MATMIKEKRKEKKKSKDKHSTSIEREHPSNLSQTVDLPNLKEVSTSKGIINAPVASTCYSDKPKACLKETGIPTNAIDQISGTKSDAKSSSEILDLPSCSSIDKEINNKEQLPTKSDAIQIAKTDLVQERVAIEGNEDTTMQQQSTRLKRDFNLSIDPELERKTVESISKQDNTQRVAEVSKEMARNLEIKVNTALANEAVANPYQNLSQKLKEDTELHANWSKEMRETGFVDEKGGEVMEDVVPSAPVLEDHKIDFVPEREECVAQLQTKPKIQCIPLEEAMRIFGEREIAEVTAMSEREEAIVEAGPLSGPDNPLVDLLSNFRSSLIALERERAQIARNFIEEEKYRNGLWHIEKRSAYVSETCPCGATISFKATYEHAELMKKQLPVAKLKLEGLVRDIQDSYRHHQHMALLTHCQIEELVSEIVQGSKEEIREGLALVLRALRLCEAGANPAPAALPAALQRWAAALSAALLDARDYRHLLHLLHHLFRQTRSVSWAARLISIPVRDRSSAAQAIAILDLLLNKQRLDAALECVEDADASWEEVDMRGGGGAVSAGALRERDVLALLRAFPLRTIVARILLFTHSDISKARACDWGDGSGGHGVLRAVCGARTLAAAAARAVTSRAHYARLREELRALTARALHALAGLHLHTKATYAADLVERISAELEASFVEGFASLAPDCLHELPASLLREETAREYCIALILGLHDKSPKYVDTLAIDLPVIPCEARVRIIVQAAIDREYDDELARIVLQFLFQVGIKKKAPCKGRCEATAKGLMPTVLSAHSYLHTTAFHIIADIAFLEQLDSTSLDPLSPITWRPHTSEVRAVLDDWAQRCSPLIQHLLLKLDYTPHTGPSLETQLAIGSWLCSFCKQAPTCPEWAWSVLRKLNVHRSSWSLPLDAPAPDPEPEDLLSMAYALLSSSWGHCVPLICSVGVSALIKLACARVSDAVYCLAPVMLLMSHSPESVSLTPGFSELFAVLLKSGPTLVQRALGRGPAAGCDLLTALVLKQLDSNYAGLPRSAVLSAWLHALWRSAPATPATPATPTTPTTPATPAAAALLDTVLLAARDWQLFDSHAAMLLQNGTDIIEVAVRFAYAAPLTCECVLRAAHTTRELDTSLFPTLLNALHLQRTAGSRIHVDNALKQVCAGARSEHLVVYRAAAALLAAPPAHPSTLLLWRLFLHIYLQRPPAHMTDTTPPVGPLFFNGIMNSRLLAQVRKKLQETILYHHNEAESIETKTPEDTPEIPARKQKTTKTTDGDLLPMLDLSDLTGQPCERDEDIEEVEIEIVQTKDVKRQIEEENILKFHKAAEKMCKQYLVWIDEWDNTRAMPHHADVARFIPEQALAAAWDRELSRRRPPPPDETPPSLAPRPTPQLDNTPFGKTMASLMKIPDRSYEGKTNVRIKSLLEDTDLRSDSAVANLINSRLRDLDQFAIEWAAEYSRLSALDKSLWDLVTSLRMRRPLPPVKKQCPQKCKPVTIHIPHEEWCISTGAEQGIIENRHSARTLIRKLVRPRSEVARASATLLAVAKYIRSMKVARQVLDLSWRSAGRAGAAPVTHSLTALVQIIAERWLFTNGACCVELLSKWCAEARSGLQQALCGLLLYPHLDQHWARAYIAVLEGQLPPHTAFSLLSKFELSRWAATADPTQRRDLLDALLKAVQKWGPTPDPEYHVLLELLGVHISVAMDAGSCVAAVRTACGAAAARTLPPALLPHLVRALAAHAQHMEHHQLGHLLRSLGAGWWAARSGLARGRSPAPHAAYAPHVAGLLAALLRAFVASAVALSYTPQRVAVYAWSALQESWGPWITPSAAAVPLLPSTEEQDGQEAYTAMLKRYIDNIHQIMLDCPGTESSLLGLAFDWTVQTYLGARAVTSQECRVQLSALLEALRGLPWAEHQWFQLDNLQGALQVCSSNEREIQSWCSEAWRGLTAESWLAAVRYEHVAPHLASLLYLFTAMTHHSPTLDEATHLPWHRLPEAALEEAMNRFFVQYHNAAQPYHELPQFRVLLSAAELSVPAHGQAAADALSRSKRVAAVSLFVRAAAAPALRRHLPAHVAHVLRVLTHLAPYIEGSEGEIEELLSRAVVILCMDPAAADVLAVWQQWVLSASYRLSCACAAAASALTALEPFAALADTTAQAVLAHQESEGWSPLLARWARSPWTEPAPLAARARLHAAYVIAHTHPQDSDSLRATMLAVAAATVDFVVKEAIVAVWLCYAARIAMGAVSDAVEAAGAAAECRAGALALLQAGAAEPRRSLLHVLTMTSQAHYTDIHRLLARLALCIVNKSSAAVSAYEAACTALLGPTSDALAWGADPSPKKLPRLAMRLLPKYDKYFQMELDLAPE